MNPERHPAMNKASIFLAIALLGGTTLSLPSCSSKAANGEQPVSEAAPALAEVSQPFRDYWYAGKAELNRYDLVQARYGEYHSGDAVLVFVAEDINTQSQVKHDGTNGPKSPVLKVNFNRKWWTGVYPYSTLMSVSAPVDGLAPAWKVSGSCEEWCGHTYMQLNRRGKSYDGTVHSYFPNEADQSWKIQPDLLEDEVWIRIRTNPSQLPQGELKVYPGVTYVRLLHQDASIRTAKGTLTEEGELSTYTLAYSDIQRVLSITFRTQFPHEIESWEEKFMNPFGEKKWMTTQAKRTHHMMLDYWSHHSNADSSLRKELGLISGF